MAALVRRARSTVLLVVVFTMVLAVPASGNTAWRTDAKVSSRAGAAFVSEVMVGTVIRADAVQAQFRSPDGKARTVEAWYFAECADGKVKEKGTEVPIRITTAAGGGWTRVTIFKVGSRAGECWVEAGGWYEASNRQLEMRIRSAP
jgi:hypothetical protein